MVRIGRLFLVLALVVVFGTVSTSRAIATGSTGPIQLGGDDANDHGHPVAVDADSDPESPDVPATAGSWRYIMMSLETMLATETRSGASNDIVVIGTDGSDDYVTGQGLTPHDGGASCLAADSDDTYCMMETIKVELDRRNGSTLEPTVRYLELANDIDEFFEDLAAGTSDTSVIFIPGDEGTNDFASGASPDDMVDGDTSSLSVMEQILLDNAGTLQAFNAAGGGVLSSGCSHYRIWLPALVPSIDLQTDDHSGVLGMTSDGASLWGGLTDSDLEAAWHCSFTGELGGLRVLAKGYGNSGEGGWTDADSDHMVDAGEAAPFNWRGPNGIQGDGDDQQTVVVIGGAAGEAALGEALPSTDLDTSTLPHLFAAAALAAAGAGLMIRRRTIS